MKKPQSFLILLLGLVLFLAWDSGHAFAQFTGAKNMDKGSKLALSVLDAYSKGLEKDKDLKDALKETAKKELAAWMWDSIGGYEKIWSGQLDGDAYYSKQARMKLQKTLGVLKLVDEVSTALGAGKYDEAAFKTIDMAVAELKLPIVAALWTTIKVTYQSHQLVMDTRAALEIEAIYGKVESDKKLLGALTPNSDQPKLIPETADSADYFFEKYLITDDATRNLVKTYVRKVIGDEWPEQTWGQWLNDKMALGSGVDTARSAEIESLDREWRNKARGWIMALLKDVNKQAKVRWGEMRVTQQLAEFRAFQAEVGHFYNNDLEQMLQEFEARKARRLELPKYREYPAKSAAERVKIEAQVGKLKPSDMRLANRLRDEIQDPWRLQGNSFRSGASILGEMELADAIRKEIVAWDLLDDGLYKVVKENINTILPGVTEEKNQEMATSAGDNPDESAIANAATRYANVYGKVILKPFDWYGVDLSLSDGRVKRFTPEEAQSAVLAALNEGDFTTAKEIIDGWTVTMRGAIDRNNVQRGATFQNELASKTPDDITAAIKGLQDSQRSVGIAIGALDEKIGKIQVEANAVLTSYRGLWNATQYGQPNTADRLREVDGQLAAMRSQLDAFNGQIADLNAKKARLHNTPDPLQAELNILNSGWRRAHQILAEAMALLIKAEDTLYGASLSDMEHAFGAFKDLANVRAEQWKRYKDEVADIKARLPLAPNDAGSDWKPKAVASMEQFETFVKDRSYTFIGPMGPGTLLWLYLDVRGYAGNIQGGIVDAGRATSLITEVDSAVKEWDRALEKLKDLKEPDNESLLQISVLVDKSVDPGEVLKSLEALKGVAGKVPGYKDAVSPDKIGRLMQTADTDGVNRERDAFWLLQRSKEVENFFKGQMEKRNLRRGSTDYEVNLLIANNGMVREEEPFPHYLTAAGLQKGAMLANRIRKEWQDSPAFAFMQKYAVGQFKLMEEMLGLPGVKAAPEENYIRFAAGSPVVWKSALDKAEAIMKELAAEDKDYAQKIADVERLLPGTVHPSSEKLVGYTTDEYIYEEVGGRPSMGHPLAQRYVGIYKTIKASLNRRLDYLSAKRNLQYQAGSAAINLRTKLSDAILYMQTTYMDRGDYQAVAGQGPFYEQIKGEYASLGLKDDEIETNLMKLLALVESARIKLKDQKAQENAASERIRELYGNFKNAYESRNDSAVVSYLSGSWQSDDGSGVPALQNRLRQTFRVFDEVRYNMQNLAVQRAGENRYSVSYEVTITSKIYKRNITHEEKSTVSEEVTIDPSGKAKISKTTGGRFWYSK